MKYVKLLGLAAMAAMALMAFTAGTASATKLCTTSNCSSDLAAGSEIVSSLTGTAVLETTGGTVLDTCSGGGAGGKTKATSGSPLTGKIESLTWSGCTKTTDTLYAGEFSIEYTSGNDGIVYAENQEVTINTIFGSCVYGTFALEFIPLGTLNGGATAKLEINAVVPKISGNGTCPEDARWTATYVVTTPSSLYVAS